MRLAHCIIAGVAVLVPFIAQITDASACGGCFHEAVIQQGETTQVTGHRMILSVSSQQTTLWDQIKYSGNPKSFAWVLPIKGQVDVGLSSDLLFEQLEALTQVRIDSPQITCAPSSCQSLNTGFSAASGGPSGGGFDDAGVTVIASKVVGPYQTVQLSAQDPKALETWLSTNGYALPADIKPVVAAYVTEGFNFLALKLIPGASVAAMQPVRVTTPGASPVLPLRMVAAGTGAITSMTLWIIGEGRYETTNQPAFQVDSSALVWNWDTSSSNYAEVVKQEFAASNNAGWLIEAGENLSAIDLRATISSLIQFNPGQSGYGTSSGAGGSGSGGASASDAGADDPTAQSQADLDTLFAGIGTTSTWINRLHGELGRAALATDLQIGASKDQGIVTRNFTLTQTMGTAPKCPPDPCAVGSASSGAGGSALTGVAPPSDSGCAVALGARGAENRESDAPIWLLGCGALALAALRRRGGR